MDTRREAQIQRQIEKVKRDLAVIGDLRPGSLSTQNTFCSSPGCHCKANPPIKHGPYNQLSYTRKGRSSTKFIRDKHLSDIQKQVSAKAYNSHLYFRFCFAYHSAWHSSDPTPA